MSRSRGAFARVVIASAAAASLAAGCGQPAASPRAASPTSPPARVASPEPASAPPSAVPPASDPPNSAPPAPPALVRHAFPVVGKASYAHTHHDYPASDIIAPCGETALSPVDGVVLEVTRVDTFDPKVNAGATRGGLSVSILGNDGVRYYGSHYSSIKTGIDAGVRLTAGQPIAVVGRTGDAGACHVHFGLSPVCQRTDDWWIRRGVIWPWSYLDSWRAGGTKSPVAEITSWQTAHGCPTKPLVDP